MPDDPQAAEPVEPRPRLFECMRCGIELVSLDDIQCCEDCEGHPLMVFRCYATDEEVGKGVLEHE